MWRQHSRTGGWLVLFLQLFERSFRTQGYHGKGEYLGENNQGEAYVHFSIDAEMPPIPLVWSISQPRLEGTPLTACSGSYDPGGDALLCRWRKAIRSGRKPGRSILP